MESRRPETEVGWVQMVDEMVDLVSLLWMALEGGQAGEHLKQGTGGCC